MAERPPGRRLFFALWPQPPLQAAMAATASGIARSRALGGRDVPAERLHLTLLFLGEVAPEVEKRVVAAAGRIAARPFDLTLDQAGCFFRSKVFWLGASQAPRKLGELAGDLRKAMAGVGLAPDRKELVPHVTCVRDIRHVIRPVPITPIIWPARGFALVHSTGKGDAHLFPSPPSESTPSSEKGVRPLFPQYHVVSHWPLQTASTQSVKSVQNPGGPE